MAPAPTGTLLLFLILVLSVAAVASARRHPGDGVMVTVLAAGAASCAVAAALMHDIQLVPGLLPAFPFLAAGFAGLRRSRFGAATRFLAASSAVYAGAILLTQYGDGGSAEWGGRYFAAGLPLAIPLAVAGARDAAKGLERPARGALVTGLVVVTAMSSFTALRGMHEIHAGTRW
ncbi:hypothetical protein BH24ACT3_BH24ACT3_02660 [soil metagenome]